LHNSGILDVIAIIVFSISFDDRYGLAENAPPFLDFGKGYFRYFIKKQE